jgi:hypothetical protein
MKKTIKMKVLLLFETNNFTFYVIFIRDRLLLQKRSRAQSFPGTVLPGQSEIKVGNRDKRASR